MGNITFFYDFSLHVAVNMYISYTVFLHLYTIQTRTLPIV